MVSERDMMTQMERAGRALGMKMVHSVGVGGGVQATFELTLALDGDTLADGDAAAELALRKLLGGFDLAYLTNAPMMKPTPEMQEMARQVGPRGERRIDGRSKAARAMRENAVR